MKTATAKPSMPTTPDVSYLRHQIDHLKRLVQHHDLLHTTLSNAVLNQAATAHNTHESHIYAIYYLLFTLIFIFIGCIFIVASGTLSHQAGGSFGLGTDATFRTTVSDGLYASWLMVTTIGYGDTYPTTDGGKVMAMLYMLLTMAFVSRAMSALYVYLQHISEESKRAMRDVASEKEERAAAWLFDWASGVFPLFLAWFYIDFVSLLFAGTEGWKEETGEWGCRNCRLFAFMTMTTIGWGIGDFYDPVPPWNAANLTVYDEMVTCAQQTTRGKCIWSSAGRTCVCSLSQGGRYLLFPFSIIGVAITGVALATLFDLNFWKHRICCCMQSTQLNRRFFRVLRRPFSAMKRTSSLLANAEFDLQDEAEEHRKRKRKRNSGCHPSCCSCCHCLTWITKLCGTNFRALLLPLVPFILLVVILPLCIMSWISRFVECVGDAEHLGDLQVGFLSAAFVIIQTASTVG